MINLSPSSFSAKFIQALLAFGYVALIRQLFAIHASLFGWGGSGLWHVAAVLVIVSVGLVLMFLVNFVLLRHSYLQLGIFATLVTFIYYYIYNTQGQYIQFLADIFLSPPHLINMFLLVASPVLVGRFLQSRFNAGTDYAQSLIQAGRLTARLTSNVRRQMRKHMFPLFFGIGLACMYFGYSMCATIDQIADMLGGRQVLGTWALFEHMKQTGAIYMIMLMSFAAFALGFANIAAGMKKNIRPHVRTLALVAAILYGLYSSTIFLPPILRFFVSFAFPRPYIGPREVTLLPIYMFGVSVFSFFVSWAVHQQPLAEQAEKVTK